MIETYKAHKKDESWVHKLKCEKCDYECQWEIVLMKHMNTKQNETETETKYDNMNEENDHFQTDIFRYSLR